MTRREYTLGDDLDDTTAKCGACGSALVCPACDAERALLARDVAEVERAILVFAKTAKLHEEAIVLDEETEAKYPANRTSGAQNAHRLDVLIWHATAHRSRVCIDDCQAWLTRARAALS